MFSTLLGGSGSDQATGLAVDSAGNVWIAGSTSSTDFPLVNAFQAQLAGGNDVFIGTLNATGDQLLYSSYVGGGTDDSALAIGIDNKGSEVVGGIAQSSSFPVTAGVIQPQFGGSYDGFVFKLKNGICPYNLSANALNVAASGASGTITASAAIGCNAPAVSSNVPWASASVAGNSVNWTVTANPSSFGRNGALNISGQAVTITQAGLPCSYALNAASVSAGSAGGTGNIAVTPSPGDCLVTASSGVSWASLSVSGNNVSWSISANPSSLGRNGSFTIGGLGVSVSQSGVTCSYGLSTTSINAGSAGASGNIAITPAPSDCPSASTTSNVVWASISTSGSTAPWTISSNAGSQSRNGIFTVAGQSVAINQTGIASPGTLTLNRTVLNFGYSGSLVTSTQTVAVGFASGSGVAWTPSSSQPNITVSPGGGSGSGSFTVTAIAGASGTVTVTAPGAAKSPLQVQINVRAVTLGSPIGSFDTPVSGTSGIAGAIPVTGWALDNIEVIKVDIWREPVGSEPAGLAFIGDAGFVADARPDVEAGFPNSPFNYRGGWGYMLLTNLLPNGGGSPGPGNGTFALHAIAHNKAGISLDLGTRTITVDNAHAARPFGTIDTPGQGATISGNAYVNFGWALTQNPYVIAKDGSTITVIVDGQRIGHPTYNQYRSDIANFFPGLANSNGAVGFFYIDATTLANGVHTISWVVFDNGGRGDGIGSRYFTVQNGGNAIPVSGEEPVLVPVGGFQGEIRDVEMDELARIELELGATDGYLLLNGERRPLPVGSSIKRGVFYWQAGPGFLGEYSIVFERPGSPDLIVRMTIRPKRFP